MITFFIDPAISSPQALAAIIEEIQKQNPEHIVCFFNPYQAEFFRQHNISVTCYSTDEWAMTDRNNDMVEIMQGFNDMAFKPWSNTSFSVNGNVFNLNVFRFLSANFIIKGLFLPVAKTMAIYSQKELPSAVVIFGSADFFHHVKFCLNIKGSATKIQGVNLIAENRHHSRKEKVAGLVAFAEVIRLKLARKILNKKVILVQRSAVTEDTIACLKKDALLIHSINRLIPSFLRISDRKDLQSVETCFVQTLEREKEGKADSSKLAIDIAIDFIRQGYLQERMQKTFSVIRILNFLKPDGIVQLNLNGELNVYQIWASAVNAPTFCLQHGIQGKFSFEVKYDLESDYYFAWANLPVDSERSDGAVKVLGNPLYKTLTELTDKNDAVKKVLIAPTALPYYKSDADYDFWKGLISYLKDSDFDVMIKFHHKDRFKNMVMDLLLTSGIKFTTYRGSLHRAIRETDLVITTVSTVALDAFQFSKPVIILNNAVEGEFFTQYDAGKVLIDPIEIGSEIQSLMNDSAYYRKRIESQAVFFVLFCADESPRKIANEIVKLVERKN